VVDGTYQPLSRPIFIYVSVSAAKKPEVDKLVTYYLEQASALASRVGYVGLPATVSDLTKARFKARKTGSVFTGGSKIGVTLESLLSAEGAGS
jgi:phosphate transport system substrate-binding protein